MARKPKRHSSLATRVPLSPSAFYSAFISVPFLNTTVTSFLLFTTSFSTSLLHSPSSNSAILSPLTITFLSDVRYSHYFHCLNTAVASNTIMLSNFQTQALQSRITNPNYLFRIPLFGLTCGSLACRQCNGKITGTYHLHYNLT